MALACLAWGLAARAAGPLGPNGSPLRTSQYTVDLTQGPVLASSRVTGLAGAYVAIAEGVEGIVQTPVAPAVRPAYSVDHFDYDIGLGLTLPSMLRNTDFFNQQGTNSVVSDPVGFVFVNPAALVQIGELGLGAAVKFQNFGLNRQRGTATDRRDRLRTRFASVNLQAAHMFFDRELVLGLGLRALTLSLRNDAAPLGERQLFATTGVGWEIGGLYMPTNRPYRIGASFSSAFTTAADRLSQLQPDAAGDRVVGDPADPDNAFWLPEEVSEPWQLNVGFAVQLGPRPLNPGFIDPEARIGRAERALARRAAEREHRYRRRRANMPPDHPEPHERERALRAKKEHGDALDELHLERVEHEARQALRARYARMSRQYVLISMSLVATGRLHDAVGVGSFLQRVVSRSGQQVTLSPRLGLETEPVPHWVKVRAGTYGEPSRFEHGAGRLHGTLGFDVKLFPWGVFGLFDRDTHWRIGGVLDAAQRYFSWGVGIGIWH